MRQRPQSLQQPAFGQHSTYVCICPPPPHTQHRLWASKSQQHKQTTRLLRWTPPSWFTKSSFFSEQLQERALHCDMRCPGTYGKRLSQQQLCRQLMKSDRLSCDRLFNPKMPSTLSSAHTVSYRLFIQVAAAVWVVNQSIPYAGACWVLLCVGCFTNTMHCLELTCQVVAQHLTLPCCVCLPAACL